MTVTFAVRSRASAVGAKTEFRPPDPTTCPGWSVIGKAGSPDSEKSLALLPPMATFVIVKSQVPAFDTTNGLGN